MHSKKNYAGYLIASLVAFLVFSISFLLMPVEAGATGQGQNIFSIIAGLMFWSGLITGIVMQIVLSKERKKWFKKNRVELKKTGQLKPGLISFFKNKTAFIFDVLLLASLIGFTVAVILTKAIGYSCYILLSLVSFSFCAHCIFNGKNFYFVENKDNLKKQK